MRILQEKGEKLRFWRGAFFLVASIRAVQLCLVLIYANLTHKNARKTPNVLA